MPTSFYNLPVILGLQIALLITGLLVLRFGRWPKRKGDSPHCRKCDYNLTGLGDGNCPECGNAFTLATANRGDRKRNPALIWAGSAMISIALVFASITAYRKAMTVNWYHYRPYSWVRDDLAHAKDPSTAYKAFLELNQRQTAAKLSPAEIEQFDDAIVTYVLATPVRTKSNQRAYTTIAIAPTVQDKLLPRINKGKLSPKPLARLIEQSLVEQVSHPDGVRDWGLISVLDLAQQNKLLTTEQETRFFKNLAAKEIVLRPKNSKNSKIPFRIATGEFHTLRWSFLYIGVEEIWVDDHYVESDRLSLAYTNDSPRLRNEIMGLLPAFESGTHTLQFKVRAGYSDNTNPRQGLRGPLPDSYHDFEMSTTFEVVDSINVIKLNKQPDAMELAKCFQVEHLRSGQTGDFIFGSIRPKNLPIDCAFSIFALWDGKEYPCGQFIVKKEDTRFSDTTIMGHLPANPKRATIDLILRTNTKLAEEQVDFTEIWDGEIMLKNIPVTIY